MTTKKSLGPHLCLDTCLVVLLVGLGFLFPACRSSTGPDELPDFINPLPGLSISWNAQNSLVCFGTSLTYGYYGLGPIGILPRGEQQPLSMEQDFMSSPHWIMSLTGSSDSSYPKFLGEKLRINVLNKGYMGARADYALRILDSVVALRPCLILLEFGANDLFQSIPAAVFEEKLDSLVNNILEAGSKVVLIAFLNHDIINSLPSNHPLFPRKELSISYLAALRRIAARHSVPIFEDALKGIFGDPRFMSADKIHPNGIGYGKMGENIFKGLFNTFRQSNMLK